MGQIIIFLTGFLLVTLASERVAKLFTKIKLPIITGFLVVGILSGPFVLKLLSEEGVQKIGFLNDFSLAFIAFAAGTELFLRDLKGQMKSILWNTFAQLVIVFVVSCLAVFYLADYIPLMRDMGTVEKIAVSILFGTIFVARSPSSAIAIIKEMRAKGVFVKTVISVKVIIDVLVVILFAICFSIATSLVQGLDFNPFLFGQLGFEIILAFAIGYVLGKTISLILSSDASTNIKMVLILALGFGVYMGTSSIGELSEKLIHVHLHLEPLLICILGSFYVTNFTKHRLEFHQIIHDAGPFVYAIFFTLTGASMSLDILLLVWPIALALFFVRLLALAVASYVGGTLAKNPLLHKRIGWMPHITQAGVGIGLATTVSNQFTDWGVEFYTIIIAVIVISQTLGPPLFKWSILLTGESHLKAKKGVFDGVRDAIIFGLENNSIALARRLQEHNWQVKIATTSKKNYDREQLNDIKIIDINKLDLASLEKLEAKKAEAVVLMLSDKENLALSELIYEHIGTKDVVVLLKKREYFDKFHELGNIIVEPSTALIGLLDHSVRSPNATSLLLGNEENQDTIDVEMLDSTLNGELLRNLHLPQDVIILSVKRKGQMIISHGYTQIKKNDVLTVVGSLDSLEKVILLFAPDSSV